ncbi:bacteriocin immunity protein [Streptococcus pluranimalium]|uniref:bacteriocin immunity protein n=1 Tax=Streptococcus pluranimalium TaxID=82348 RepID=UPI0039FBFE1D
MKINEEKILNSVYNILLNTDTTEDERRLLIKFKERVEGGSNFQKSVICLAEELRILSVRNLQKNTKLSKDVAELYKEMSTVGEFDRNLARGLISFGIIR